MKYYGIKKNVLFLHFSTIVISMGVDWEEQEKRSDKHIKETLDNDDAKE